MPEAIEVYDGMKQRFDALKISGANAGQIIKPCKYEAELDAASKELEKHFDMQIGLLLVAEAVRVLMRELEEKRAELLAMKIAGATARQGDQSVVAEFKKGV